MTDKVSLDFDINSSKKGDEPWHRPNPDTAESHLRFTWS